MDERSKTSRCAQVRFALRAGDGSGRARLTVQRRYLERWTAATISNLCNSRHFWARPRGADPPGRAAHDTQHYPKFYQISRSRSPAQK